MFSGAFCYPYRFHLLHSPQHSWGIRPFIYQFVLIYNQFFWPLLVTNTDRMRTIQIGISLLVTGDIVNYGHILAGAVIAILPSALIYIIGQDYMIKGMTAGGVKG